MHDWSLNVLECVAVQHLSHNSPGTLVVYRSAQTNDNTIIKTMTQFLEKYTSYFIWKGCVWEGVGDWTELQHIDPHSIGHNRVSFPFSWAAQLGAWGPSLSETCSSIQHLFLNLSDPQLQLLNRGPEGPLCWVLAFSTASFLQLVWSPN